MGCRVTHIVKVFVKVLSMHYQRAAAAPSPLGEGWPKAGVCRTLQPKQQLTHPQVQTTTHTLQPKQQLTHPQSQTTTHTLNPQTFKPSTPPPLHPPLPPLTPVDVRLLSACCPLDVRLLSAFKADIKRTTSGHQPVLVPLGGGVGQGAYGGGSDSSRKMLFIYF